ncbi:hypothetical protein T439DRAFT_158525 [Meredithblackwellia eburnea MCA 4105]
MLQRVDDYFRRYQMDDARKLFCRNAISTHKLAGETLCSQFTFNSGHGRNPISRFLKIQWNLTHSSFSVYKHVVHVPTYSFEDSPTVVKAVRNHLSEITLSIVQDPERVNFNECYSVAYMEGGKMNFHDDGEKGLGPVVSTMSMGCDAIMSFREKAKRGKPITLSRPDGTKVVASIPLVKDPRDIDPLLAASTRGHHHYGRRRHTKIL